jgi:hypothetical protein
MHRMSDSTRDAPAAPEVAAFLRRNPRFLADFPDLAQAMVIPREAGSATSLASYQLEVLRDKNRELNRRLHELYQTANDNERLTVRTHQLTLALLRADSTGAALSAMVACLTEDFGSELVRMVLFEPVVERIDAPWLRVLPADDRTLAPFAEFLAAGEPLCGRLQPVKLAALFGDEAAQVQSTALLHLGGRGMLAIGSADDNRFFPGMGTLFLRLMAESLVAALARFERRNGG